jgi:sigma-B regulation protein RsbU (phosphoserine phosphatase)
MAGRNGGVDAPAAAPRSGGSAPARLPPRARHLLVVGLLLAAVWAALRLVDQPGTAVSMYSLVPILLTVYWFELPAGLGVAGVATAMFLLDNRLTPAAGLSGGTLVLGTLNRALVFVGVAVLFSLLLRRERALTRRVRSQQDELSELESLRALLTPADIPLVPHLQIAASFTPADGVAAGDFYLVVPGPGNCTTIVVGDVVGHGLESARRAAFVRAALATFARFSSDPVQLLQLANAALAEGGDDSTRFVTAVCLTIGAPPEVEVRWAAAGHDVPWYLDTGAPLPGGRVSVPLGVGPQALAIESGTATLPPGAGILAYTDGLPEGRPARRSRTHPLELFGEDRARTVIQAQRGATPATVLDALVGAMSAFAGGPLADDVCLVAVRAC